MNWQSHIFWKYWQCHSLQLFRHSFALKSACVTYKFEQACSCSIIKFKVWSGRWRNALWGRNFCCHSGHSRQTLSLFFLGSITPLAPSYSKFNLKSINFQWLFLVYLGFWTQKPKNTRKIVESWYLFIENTTKVLEKPPLISREWLKKLLPWDFYVLCLNLFIEFKYAYECKIPKKNAGYCWGTVEPSELSLVLAQLSWRVTTKSSQKTGDLRSSNRRVTTA